MKTLIINAASPSQTEVDELQEWISSSSPGNHQLTRVNLQSKKILPCQACMLCQIKNPGICVIKDDMQELLPAYVCSDVVVIITSLFCGGYSSELKKFIDRMCPVLTACFEKRDAETRHIPRYEKRPTMIGIGLTDTLQPSDIIFTRLFTRNMKQFNIHKHSCQVIMKGMQPDELAKTFRKTFSEAGLNL